MIISNWQERADRAQEQLNTVFWNEKENVYDPFTSHYREDFEDFHYWWMAHAIDVLLDAFQRTGEVNHIKRINKLLSGCKQKSNEKLINNYYDDMEWMALAALRAFSLTNDRKYFTIAEELWRDIEKGWNDHCGGGIAWRKQQLDYKNTPANAPAVILALRLYDATKNKNYLSKAETIFTWLEDNLIDHKTGFVWDGINREGNMKIDKDWEYTYNQGVYIGACIEYYKLKKDSVFLEKALKTAKSTFERLSEDGTKILQHEGKGDCGLFKGIFIRYTEEILKYKFDNELYQVFLMNGEYAWKSFGKYRENLFGDYWLKENKDSSVTLATHLSGCKLMESIYRLEKNNSQEEQLKKAL